MQEFTKCCLNPLPPETIGSFRPFHCPLTPRLDFCNGRGRTTAAPAIASPGVFVLPFATLRSPAARWEFPRWNFGSNAKPIPTKWKGWGCSRIFFPRIMESQVKQHCGFGLVAWSGEQFSSIFHWQFFKLSAYIEVVKKNMNELEWTSLEGVRIRRFEHDFGRRYRRPQIIGWKQNWAYILLMAEILHQLIGSLPHCLQGSIHPRWCRISSINSMVHSFSF